MSKNSFRYTLNQRKYSLKFLFYIFLLFDIMLYYYGEGHILPLVLSWEVALFIGLLLGLRGQAKYKELVYDLIAITKDPRYKDKEELRGFKLARHISHATIEHDLWMTKQQAIERQSTKKFKVRKIIKLNEDKIMNENAIKELLAWVGAWIIAGGIVLDEALYAIGVSLPWIFAITFLWITGDFLYFWYLKNFWGIKKEDIPKVEPPVRIETDII